MKILHLNIIYVKKQAFMKNVENMQQIVSCESQTCTPYNSYYFCLIYIWGVEYIRKQMSSVTFWYPLKANDGQIHTQLE